MNINEYKIAKDIYEYILLKQEISLSKLRNDFKNYIFAISFKYQNEIIEYNNIFYFILNYLLINGYIEYSLYKEEGKEITFFAPKNIIIKYNNVFYSRKLPNLKYNITQLTNKDYITLDPLQLLKALPSIEDTCNAFPDNEFINFRFKYDKNKQLKKIGIITEYPYKTGIYKINDFGKAYLVLNDNKIKRIERKDKNYDALTYSFCYADLYSNNTFFTYHMISNELTINNKIIPILIYRTLYMCDFNPIIDEQNFNYPKYKFSNINKEIINELKRIFSNKSIEEKND